MSVIYWNCWHFYGADKYIINSYVKQYDSTINEAILETYSIKREMYHARNFFNYLFANYRQLVKIKYICLYIGARSYSHVIIDD
jgi:CRISPR/Cas system-associated endonuclease/helicase Cas3